MNEARRTSDADGADFRYARIPRKWKTILLAVAGVGTFIGSFWVTTHKTHEDDPKEPLVTMAKLTDIEGRITDINETLGAISGKQATLEKQIREVKKIVQGLEKDEFGYRPEERFDEIMNMLREFEKRGIKKR